MTSRHLEMLAEIRGHIDAKPPNAAIDHLGYATVVADKYSADMDTVHKIIQHEMGLRGLLK